MTTTLPWSTVLSTLAAYAAGFLVTFLWARALYRHHRVPDARAAIRPALLGGTLGGTCALLMSTADQLQLLGL